MEKLIALVDCNNFFASCERIFRPDLVRKPLLVLSANDGCVIARSDEVKALGVKMGIPLFKVKDIIAQNNINVFSTNLALYGNISNRIMHILGEYTANLEVYSIDEAFLDLSGIAESDVEEYARKIVKRIMQDIGVPISIGISQTKTLAKIASKMAKKDKESQGVKYIQPQDIDRFLVELPVKDVWGVGWGLNESFKKAGIFTALQIKNADPSLIRKKYGVNLQKTVLELNGISCMPISDFAAEKKNIMRSRSFGQKITELSDLENAVSTFISQGAADLRKHSCQAWFVSVHIRTDRHSTNSAQYRNVYTVALPYSTNNTIMLNKAALFALTKVYKPGFAYKKAGIMLSNIVSETNTQLSLGQDLKKTERHKPLMKVLDQINHKYGEHVLHIATQGEKSRWKSKSELRSPDYLGSWNNLPIVK